MNEEPTQFHFPDAVRALCWQARLEYYRAIKAGKADDEATAIAESEHREVRKGKHP